MLKDYYLNEVKNAIKKAISENKLGQMTELEDGLVRTEKPKNADFGDFAVNVSPLARCAKIAPPMIANSINEFLPQEKYTSSVTGGFINFKTGNELLTDVIEEILTKENYGKPENIKKEKINLEYISANPTGPFHIGHGRWAAMGSALANLLKFYGHEVYQEFYINDAGAQIQKLGNSLRIRIKQELGENVDFPTDAEERKNYYPGDYLIPVAKKFIEEKQDLLKSVENNLDKIETSVLSDYAKFEMESLQQKLLNKFRVHFDKFYSELTLHETGKVEECCKKLKESGKIYEKDGAVWFKSSDYGDDEDRVIIKADGLKTYLTSDIAYHKDKVDRGFDRLINIWGADHHGYVARVKASMEALGYDSSKLEILLGQLVNLIIDGNQTRMGKRKNMITLDDLIEDVGVDATRFWMCMRDINNTLDFDIELAKKSTDENPVFYVQYAHARACSILRNALKEKQDLQTGETSPALLNQEDLDNLKNNFDRNIIANDVENEKKLILKLEEFKSTIISSAENRTVYTICRYVQELAAEFHSFYNAKRVITEDKNTTLARLALVIAVKTVLETGLSILAVTAPEKM
jgi:arginyl-tRNA synthetase